MLIKEAARGAASKYSSIAVVGGGLGGLSVANALLHRGDLVERVAVYERAQAFAPTAGAGFGFSPNGQICLRSIGIDAGAIGQPFDDLKRLTKDGTAIQEQSPVMRQLRERHGFGVAGCLRADLVDLLVKQLDKYDAGGIRYSHELVRIEPQHDKVEIEFANGHEDVVDLVIGADGIQSTVAKLLDIDDATPPIYSGANIFYGKIPRPHSNEYLRDHPIFEEGSVVNGPATGEFICFHVGAGEKKTFIWANTYASVEPPAKREEWERGHADELGGILGKFPEPHPIHTLANLTAEDDLLHFGLYYRHFREKWSRGRVVLLGDSCHATLPYVGQGANQAIEDAIYLADSLDRIDVYTEAYEDYYKKRFPRTKRVVQMAGLMHNLYHSENWFMQKALDLLLSSVIRGGFVLRQMEKEIIEECPVDPASVKV